MKTLSAMAIFVGPAAVAAFLLGSLATAGAIRLPTSLPAQHKRASAGEMVAMGMGGGMGGGPMGGDQTGSMGGGMGSGQMGQMGGGMSTGPMGGGQMAPMGNGMGNGQTGPMGPTNSGGMGSSKATRQNQWRYGRRRNGGSASGTP